MVLLVICSACTPSERTWVQEDGYRWAELDVDGDDAGFQQLSPTKTGVDFVNPLSGEHIAENRHRMHGSGVALGDIDGDGWTDIYFARLDGDNALYRNKGGWRFEEVTQSAGVAASNRFSTGAVFADIDGDGDLDLLVTAMDGPNAAFLNDGTGQFTEATEEIGFAAHQGSTSMALADIDGDEDLDIYVANYKKKAMRDSLPPPAIAWERVVQQTGEQAYNIHPDFKDDYYLDIRGTKILRFEFAEEDVVYVNQGDGTLQRKKASALFVPDENGRLDSESSFKDWALAVRFQDFNGDGAPDLYVCNDFESPDYVMINDRAGTFRPISPYELRKTSNATMSVAFSDINHDGYVDFFLADMLSTDYSRRQKQKSTQVPLPAEIGDIEHRPQIMQNTFLLNRGDHSFAEVSHMSGLQASDWTWSSVFLDVDLDGYEDLLATNGHAFDVQNLDAQQQEMQRLRQVRSFDTFRRLILDFPPLSLPNVAFQNEDGLRFNMKKAGWGFGAEPDVSHGMALADLDNDGDQDIVVNRLNKAAGIYENEGIAARVAVRLKGVSPNTQAIGAKIRLHGGAVPVQEREVVSGGLYLSGSDPVQSFAAGTSEAMRLEITWRNGEKTHVDEVRPDRIYEITQSDQSSVAQRTTTPTDSVMFVEVPFDYVHEEEAFDDFGRQPLLPRKMSQSGPAVVWADVDRDGDDDVLIGSGTGGRIGFYTNDGRGGMTRQSISPLNDVLAQDVSGILVIPEGRGSQVLIASSNYESPRRPSSIKVYSVQGRQWRLRQELLFEKGSIGPLAAADIDGDGDVDVFAGGLVLPGAYPMDASSAVYLNDGSGRYALSEPLSAPFEQAGLVKGAAFGDLDQDGDADLALAREWGPIAVFVNDGTGLFSDESESWDVSEYTGLWQGVDWMDANNDGRLDLVATNWGWNSPYGRPDQKGERRLYWGDYDGNGVLEVLESHFESSIGAYVPDVGLNLLMYSLPFLRQRIQSFEAFSTMSLAEVIGPAFEEAQYKPAKYLGHAVFLNEGSSFEMSVLPMLSQVAPAFGVGIGDYNGDGQEDAFFAQNFFAERLETPRSDAGRGLWLQGQGDGEFELAEGVETGVKVYGEQRGIGLADMDADGRLDLAVSQNARELKIYRNVGARPGLRIKLEGPSGNPWGIGSVIQVLYADGSVGPARNVSAGSGYWSQHSAVHVLGIQSGKEVDGIRVQWPGNKTQVVNIDSGANEVVIPFAP